MNPASQKESSGLRVNYYLVQVDHPQREEQPAYQAECEDIIDALGLTFDEANIFKEIWRIANERTHGKGKEGNNPLRAAQKLVHYAGRILKKAQRDSNTEPDAWTPWAGSDKRCPVYSKAKIDILFRDSDTRTKVQAGVYRWEHLGSDTDIVAYRLSKT